METAHNKNFKQIYLTNIMNIMMIFQQVLLYKQIISNV